MNTARFRFFAELNDFLPSSRKNVFFSYDFEGSPAIKHLIEALGVPHPEVGRILANGGEARLTYRVQPADQIFVYPADGQAAIEPRFVLDNHLGKLAIYLRILGFDALYSNTFQDDELAEIAGSGQHILLTRDRRLLMRRVVQHGYCLRSLRPEAQIAEVVRRYRLWGEIQPFRRCLRCNHPLQPVSKELILHRLESLTKIYYDEFHLCPSCDQIYWKGSHYERMQELVGRIKRER